MITRLVKDPLGYTAKPETVQLDAASQRVFDYAIAAQLIEAVAFCRKHDAALVPTRDQLVFLSEMLNDRATVLQMLIVAAHEAASAKQAADAKPSDK